MKTILFLTISIIYTASYAQTVKFVRCHNKKIVRSIEIQKKADGSGCETVYTKDGISRVEGSGQFEAGCQMVLGNIQNNLEKADWKCKDISKNSEFIY